MNQNLPKIVTALKVVHKIINIINLYFFKIFDHISFLS